MASKIKKFAVIDVETANSSDEFRWSICQVGVAVVKSGEIVDNWSQLVNPQIKDSDWSWHNIQVHGIRPSDVRRAPTFNDVIPRIRGSVARGKIVEHGRFDEDVISRICERQGLRMLTQPWRDSLTLARCAWPRKSLAKLTRPCKPSHSLPKIAPILGIRYKPHDAGEDARAAAELVLRAARVIGIERVNDWLEGVKDF